MGSRSNYRLMRLAMSFELLAISYQQGESKGTFPETRSLAPGCGAPCSYRESGTHFNEGKRK